ncbi:acyl-CoA dehydrogenase [Nocardia nova]|uniref:Acyl-CoA dehydrogenase n=1 Tax=Nocardia nova TaxID=37330 RepID=A0A2S6AWD5_9NOCA|nr:acyl-CoA dehydrogenase [Nocardia nova]PPJ39556.1 acyl-CoA dehydrogenase [Nocardia nova]
MALTSEHRDLADVAGSLIESRGGTAAARRILLDPPSESRWWEDDALWKEIVSTGWLGLHIDERFGGQGYGLPELVVVCEQMGRFAIAGPFLSTVAASAVIAEAGSDEQRARWLPKLVSGEMVAAIAPAAAATLEGRTLAGGRVSAGSIAALGEPDSDVILLPVGDDLILLEAGAGITTRRNDSVDRLMTAVTVIELDSVTVVDTFSGAAAACTRLLRLLASAEAVGGLAACTEMATGYATVRKQFGRAIGSFQAVKHHCANMLIDAELAAAVTWDAARVSGERADLSAALAAGHSLTAYQRVALENIQVHGGIAYTWEHDAHLYVHRAAVLHTILGGQETLYDAVAGRQLAGARPVHELDLPAEAEQYRHAAREFRSQLERAEQSEQRNLWARSGFLQPHWPKPFGRGADPAEQLVIEEELVGLDRPSLGLGEWVVPTLLQHGTPEQIERWVWRSLEGELRWCQLFSEPGAGSDAAAVSTKAVRVDGGWSITGQKVWTSNARESNRGLITVRTDANAPKHQGITAMVVDMAATGVEIRPLKELTGEALFNEVFFENVFVPDEDVVGQPNAGWKVVMATFGNERVTIGSGSTTLTAVDLLPLLTEYRPDDRGYARAVGELLVEENALAAVNLRQTARAVFATGPGIEGNLAKLYGAEHQQRVTELALRLAGPAVLTGGEAKLAHDFLYSRCLTIAGGTSEIIRNLIAERILGLPREPALSK